MDRVRSALSTIGAVLTGSGVLILLFVAYQLWGTTIYTASAQDDLAAEFARAKAAATATTTTTAKTTTDSTKASGATTSTKPPLPPPPPSGEAVANVRIAKIGVDEFVVEGVGVSDLRKGPGHYPTTPMPGEIGNAAIAGHRTTYGAPFNRLNELNRGDEIEVTTLKGTYLYKVESQRVVSPEQVEVLDATKEPKLTLTTCHPKYSARQRLVIVAALAPGEVATPPQAYGPAVPDAKPGAPDTLPGEAPDGGGSTREEPTSLADPGESPSRIPTVLWGLATTLVGLGWSFAVRRRRHWTTYAAGVLPFLVVLFFFYANLEVILPENFSSY